jgi:hypothetical protein
MARHLAKVRKICLALPEATEVEAWGAPTFRVGKIFAMYAQPNNHHGDGREGIWVKSPHFTQDLLVRAQPSRYFKPPYVGADGTGSRRLALHGVEEDRRPAAGGRRRH